MVDPPVGAWVDGLRRALDVPAIDRIAPHVTLVAPLNLPAGALDGALDQLHAAAAVVTGPLRLTLGPPATFLPVNPVLYLQVGGDLDALQAVRHALGGPPLERADRRPWVPHVTIASRLDDERIAALVGHLGGFSAVADVERITLLDEHRRDDGRRHWVALADAMLGPPVVVGRGGLELRLITGRTLDPGASELLGRSLDGISLPDRLVVTGRREGVTVGAAAVWRDDAGGHVRVVVAPDHRRSGVGAHLLASAEHAARREGWACPTLTAEGPAGFYVARSAWARPAAAAG